MLKSLIISTCFLIAGFFIQSKDLPEKSTTYTVYINFENYSVRANVLYDAAKVKAKMGYMYYWYVNNDIKNTDGSFDGKLLHGEYKSFYRNLSLMEQGNFNHGLKEGSWKTWYTDGKIHEISYYKKGKENGEREVYDEQGNKFSKTHYKNGVIHGKVIIYQKGKADSIAIYKNGDIQLPKASKTKEPKKQNRKDSVKSEVKKPAPVKDTIARSPKSSFKLKKVFSKSEKISKKDTTKSKNEVKLKKAK